MGHAANRRLDRISETPDDALRDVDVLFLCTGNICRSPVAEALLRHRLDGAGIPAHVHSAGLTMEGRPITAESAALLSRRAGIDARAHRSRRMDAHLLTHADLVIGMTREHVREAVTTCPEVWPRTFTLKELVRRGEQAGGRAASQPLDEWLAKVAPGRKTSDLLGWDAADDVADPYGLGVDHYEEMVEEVASHVDRLARLVWGV